MFLQRKFGPEYPPIPMTPLVWVWYSHGYQFPKLYPYLQYPWPKHCRIFNTCVEPKLPLPRMIPVFPEVCPSFLEIMCVTILIHLLYSPLSYNLHSWSRIYWYQWMCTQIGFNQVDNRLVVLQWTEGTHLTFLSPFIGGSLIIDLPPLGCWPSGCCCVGIGSSLGICGWEWSLMWLLMQSVIIGLVRGVFWGST